MIVGKSYTRPDEKRRPRFKIDTRDETNYYSYCESLEVLVLFLLNEPDIKSI